MAAEWVQVRLDPAAKRAVETAARDEGIPVSAWVRRQVMAGLYLAGVQTAPQTIYQGIRHALEPELAGLAEVRAGLDGLIVALPDLIALAASTQDSDAIRDAAIDVLEAVLGEAFAGEDDA